MNPMQLSLEEALKLDLSTVSQHALPALSARLNALYETLDAVSPDEEDEEAYTEWLEQLEALDSLMEDVDELH